jgi:hypothetical protein
MTDRVDEGAWFGCRAVVSVLVSFVRSRVMVDTLASVET